MRCSTLMTFFLVVSGLACGGGADDAQDDRGTEETVTSDSNADLHGTWVIDREAMKPVMEALAREQVGGDGDMMRIVLPTMMKMLEGVHTTVVVEKGGTFTVKGSAGVLGNKQEIDRRGTWKAEGRGFSFTTTHKNGEKLEAPDVKLATIEDGLMTMADDKMSMVLRKQ